MTFPNKDRDLYPGKYTSYDEQELPYDAYSQFRNAKSFDMNAPSTANITPEVNPGEEATKSAAKGAMSGNPWLAGGTAALSYILAQQQQAQRNRELAKQGRIQGIEGAANYSNQALARYMQAVS
jgi:hypothetical protein